MAIKTLEQFTAEAQTEIDAKKTANGGDGGHGRDGTRLLGIETLKLPPIY